MGHFFGELVLLLLAWGFTGFVVVGIYKMFSNPRNTLANACEITGEAIGQGCEYQTRVNFGLETEKNHR
jgi:hypothetical protein